MRYYNRLYKSKAKQKILSIDIVSQPVHAVGYTLVWLRGKE